MVLCEAPKAVRAPLAHCCWDRASCRSFSRHPPGHQQSPEWGQRTGHTCPLHGVLLLGSLAAAVSLARALAKLGLTAGPAPPVTSLPAGYLNPILICLMSSAVWRYCKPASGRGERGGVKTGRNGGLTTIRGLFSFSREDHKPRASLASPDLQPRWQGLAGPMCSPKPHAPSSAQHHPQP